MKGTEKRVLAERIAALDRLVQSSLANSDRAILKAAEAQDKRFASLNEFRRILSDQQATFVTREAMDAFATQSRTDRQLLHDQVQELRLTQQSYISRAEADAEHAQFVTQIAALQGSVSRLLITLLSSLVVSLIVALVWNFTHGS